MATKHHTIILVPHAQAKLRKWRVTNLQIALFVGGFVAVTLASLGVTWAFMARGIDSVELESLREENVKLREVNTSFESSIRELEGQLGEYESRTRDLAIVAGLDGLSSGRAVGVGGVASPIDLDGSTANGIDGENDPDIDFLHYRANRLDGTLSRVATKLDERQRWISSTPAIAPVKGILTSGYGARRDPITGGQAFHPAVDLAAAPGQPVYATADGIATRVGRIGGLGNAIYLSHGFGITTRYGHMSKLNITSGDQVKRGDVIGFVGNTGRSTGYHLHYEVRIDGEAINPLAYILDGTQTR